MTGKKVFKRKLNRHIPINGHGLFESRYADNFEKNLLTRRNYPIFPKWREVEWHEFCSKTIKRIRYRIADKNKRKTKEWELPFEVQGISYPFSLNFKKGAKKSEPNPTIVSDKHWIICCYRAVSGAFV